MPSLRGARLDRIFFLDLSAAAYPWDGSPLCLWDPQGTTKCGRKRCEDSWSQAYWENSSRSQSLRTGALRSTSSKAQERKKQVEP